MLQLKESRNYADKRNYAKSCATVVENLVIVKNRKKDKKSPYYDSNLYTVIDRKGNAIVAWRGFHTITTNTSFFKKVNFDLYPDFEDLDDISLNNPEPHTTLRWENKQDPNDYDMNWCINKK